MLVHPSGCREDTSTVGDLGVVVHFPVSNMSRSYFINLADSDYFCNPEVVRILAPIA